MKQTKQRGRPTAAPNIVKRREDYASNAAGFRVLRKAAKPRPAKPASIIAQVEASGTALVLTEKLSRPTKDGSSRKPTVNVSFPVAVTVNEYSVHP